MDLICSICPWVKGKREPQNPAITIINGHAVCSEHHGTAHLAQDHRHAIVLAGGTL